MLNILFNAFQVQELENNNYQRSIVERNLTDLPDGDLLIKVHYSSLNYKDVLSSTGNKGVTRNYPHTPGIDAAGVIISSRNSAFTIGDSVIVTGNDLGMNTPGGFGEYIRVPAEWAIKLPSQMSLKESMIYGTAGFTAALSVNALITSGISPSDGEILVTGATGGVGSMAILILSHLGYSVTAATGRLEESETLIKLGAKTIIKRDELIDTSGKALSKSRWAGVVDTVGGNMLEAAIKSTQYGGCLTCCGNIASTNFTTSIYPFILRGIRLIGIDSGSCPNNIREIIWNNLSNIWKPSQLSSFMTEITLIEVNDYIDKVLDGSHKLRTIVKVNREENNSITL